MSDTLPPSEFTPDEPPPFFTPDPAAPPARPVKARRPPSYLLLFLALLAGGFVVLGLLVLVVGAVVADQGGDQGVAIIPVTGVITAESESSPLGGSTGAGAADIIDNLREAVADDGVVAIVLRIDSPGGSAAASQEVFDAVYAAREASDKPIIASMADIAASGGYYIAAGCDRIIANRATLTGSIGVILADFDMSGLLRWAKVQPEVITAGKFKDSLSPFRGMTAEERAQLQALVTDTYEQFLGDVAKGRQQPVAAVRKVAEGRVYTGTQAKQAGLVDELGGFYDAVAAAEKAAGLEPSEEPDLRYYGGGSLLEELLGQVKAPAQPLGTHLAPLWFLAPLANGPRT